MTKLRGGAMLAVHRDIVGAGPYRRNWAGHEREVVESRETEHSLWASFYVRRALALQLADIAIISTA